jgi:hypothetical protein
MINTSPNFTENAHQRLSISYPLQSKDRFNQCIECTECIVNSIKITKIMPISLENSLMLLFIHLTARITCIGPEAPFQKLSLFTQLSPLGKATMIQKRVGQCRVFGLFSEFDNFSYQQSLLPWQSSKIVGKSQLPERWRKLCKNPQESHRNCTRLQALEAVKYNQKESCRIGSY